MLTYEQFVAVLLGSIERAGLNVAYTQELLATAFETALPG